MREDTVEFFNSLIFIGFILVIAIFVAIGYSEYLDSVSTIETVLVTEKVVVGDGGLIGGSKYIIHTEHGSYFTGMHEYARVVPGRYAIVKIHRTRIIEVFEVV